MDARDRPVAAKFRVWFRSALKQAQQFTSLLPV
jgi:hypothetical protein